MEALTAFRDVSDHFSRINFDKIISEWTDSVDESETFNENVQNYIKNNILEVFHPSPDCDLNIEEPKIDTYFFKLFEVFICGSKDTEKTFNELKNLDNPSVICGKVFKTGEPAYSCKDCSVDPTCVLCIKCFNNSIHKKHHYKITTSSGCGYCDCGDPEAWKDGVYCSLHEPKTISGSKEPRAMDNLPEGIRKRATAMFLYLTNYILEILTLKENDCLPERYRAPVKSENFVTMLYNDEIHTYEQVISALTKSIHCEQKRAVNIATFVDKEGRAAISFGAKATCLRLKEEIEKNTSRSTGQASFQPSLLVKVIHNSIVAHQMFAMRTLSWFLNLVGKSDGLLHLFCSLSMNTPATYPNASVTIIEESMLADTYLWKGARILCHELFMTGILKNIDLKQKFSKIFVKVYSRLCADFVMDDHHRSVSTTNFSIQLLTVPTLARMLIREDNVLEIVLKSFIEECQHKLKDGKFNFDRIDRSSSNNGQLRYRRALYMLYDVKYLLITVPSEEEWDSEFCQNFINGLKYLLELLSYLHGVDSVKRQTGTHIEFESEWEGAFGLQIKLSDIFGPFLEWCSKKTGVLEEAFKRTVNLIELQKNTPSVDWKKIKLKVPGFDEVVQVVNYDVSTQQVSVHIALHRFLAGLCPGLNASNITLTELLGRCEPRLGLCDNVKARIALLLDPVLRVQVLIAQHRAGMWRRNGFSLINQIYFYRNVRCRTEMQDKDVILVQKIAAEIPPNEFLAHCLNKYGLLNWMKSEYDDVRTAPSEDRVVQTSVIAEEFFILILTILSERFTPNMGCVDKKDAIKREIIHLLCFGPLAHSELCKSLTEDICNMTELESIVLEVAEKKKISSGKVEYCLKKEYYNWYNPFFYHYGKTEQTKSEQKQLKRRKEENEEECLPPPKPPKFHKNIESILSLLKCDVMIYLQKIVLERMEAKRSRSASENQLHIVLHLIALGLYEEEAAHNEGKCFGYVEKALSEPTSIYQLLKKLLDSPNVKSSPMRNLLTFVFKKFIIVRHLVDSSVDSKTDKDLERFLSQSDKEKTEQKKKADIAAKRRRRILEQMNKRQKEFIQSNIDLFRKTKSGSQDEIMETDTTSVDSETFHVALGDERTHISSPASVVRKICILCQEEQDISIASKKPMVLCSFVQKSTVLSQNRTKCVQKIGAFYESVFVPADLILGTHVSTCGHVMHADCWQNWYEALTHRDRRRVVRLRGSHHSSYDIEKREYLCPLCETLGNSVLPLLPKLTYFTSQSRHNNAASGVSLSMTDWLDGLRKTVQNSIQKERSQQTNDSDEFSIFLVPCPLSSITRLMAESVAKNFQALFEYYYDMDPALSLNDETVHMVSKFALDVYFHGCDAEADDNNRNVPLVTWVSAAYTIMSTEHLLRYSNQPLFSTLPARQEDCLVSIVRYAAVATVVTQKNLIKDYCVRLLSALVCDSSDKRLRKTPSILEMDMFHLLVPLVLSLPTLFAEEDVSSSAQAAGTETKFQSSRIATGDLNSKHLLTLVFTAHVVQTILSAEQGDIFCAEDSMDTQSSDEKDEKLADIFMHLRNLAQVPTIEAKSWNIEKYIQRAVMPFLRCSGLFFHYLTSVPTPELLRESYDSESSTEFELLTKYLALPENLTDLFHPEDNEVVQNLCKSWCTDDSMKETLNRVNHTIVKHPIKVNLLFNLPDDYTDVINSASTFSCPKNKEVDDVRTPTMCLICGKMLCSHGYCCQENLGKLIVGAATAHVQICGSGTGMFFRPRECQLLMLSGKVKGCFYPPPYLDAYGETDSGLRRGNPLFLCQERLKNLNKLWLRHAIPETIAHSLEVNTNWLDYEWFNL